MNIATFVIQIYQHRLFNRALLQKRLIIHHIQWIMSLVAWAYIWMSHGTYLNGSWHIYECVMAHIWMRHGTYINESWHIYEWVMAHIWMSHGTYKTGHDSSGCIPIHHTKWIMLSVMNESWHIYEWVMVHIKQDTIRVDALQYIIYNESCPVLCADSFIYVPWLIHICATTHSHMCQVSCIPDAFQYII